MSQLKEQIATNQEEMIEHLKQLVEMESFSKDKQHLDRVASWLAEKFEQLVGGRAEIIQNETYGNHVRCEWGEGDEQLLLLAHFDTVWKTGTLDTIPFSIEENRATGPGVFDMKGGLIQGLFALRALKQSVGELNKKIVVIYDADEEIGNPTSRRLIEEEAKRSERVFVLEPAMSPKGYLKTARKGVGIYYLEVTGIPSHSGIDPDKGVSAIEELAKQTVYLHGLTNLDSGTTLNVGKIHGGSASNVMAEKAYAEIDVRAKTQEELERIHDLLMGLTPYHPKAQLSIEGSINRYPLERTEEVGRMFETARQIADEELGFELGEMETGGGSDGNLTAPFAPTLDGLGAVGDGAHALHEHLVVDKMVERSALVAHLIMHYAGGKRNE